MTQANYQTIFEIGFRSFPWIGVMHPLIFVAIGLLLVRFHKSKQIYLVMGIFMASLASLFFLILLVVFVPRFVALRSAYVSGRSSIVEGIVENFRRLRCSVQQGNPFRCGGSFSLTMPSRTRHVFIMLLSTAVQFETGWTFAFTTTRNASNGLTSDVGWAQLSNSMAPQWQRHDRT